MSREVYNALTEQLSGSEIKPAASWAMKNSKPVWAYILAAVCAVLFVAGELYELSGGVNAIQVYSVLHKTLFVNGQWWRIVTSMFVHADFAHFLGNAICLLYFGKEVTRIYGNRLFLLIFFVSGLFGNVLTLLFVKGFSLGASGAIMGLGGAIVFALLFSKNRNAYGGARKLVYFGITVLYNLLYGIVATNSNINNFAHFGGFIGGFLIALVVEAVRKQKAAPKDETA